MRRLRSVMRQDRCPECQLQRWLCVCGKMPSIATATRIIILRHVAEAKRPSNTARVLASMLPRCRILDLGALDKPLAAEAVREAIGPNKAAVLYPSQDAVTLTPSFFDGGKHFANPAGEGSCLILLDGNWNQAGRMNRRAPGLAGLPRVCLPQGVLPELSLRKNTGESRVSTAETLVHALSIIGEVAPAEQLRLGLAEFVERARFQTSKGSREQLLSRTTVTADELASRPKAPKSGPAHPAQ